jgi:membrane-bound lytic murein transglycosylase D
MAEFGEDSYSVPSVFVESVQHFIADYQGPKRKFFQKALRRSAKYVPLITTIFKQKKVPEDMAYMALVESGFSPTATSRARARGLWQFIRSTGRIYGLRINRWRDERLDPVKSTIAAREYFLDLVAIFGSRSFLLAMASYNAGEGKITSCLKRLDDPFEKRNFWAIRGCLKRETREYVPRVIAAAIIAKYPERFGFERPRPLGDVDWLVVTRPTRLSTLARRAGVSEKALRQLNPDISSKARSTPSRVINFPLAVPKGTGTLLAQAFAAVRPLRWDATALEASTFAYRVRRGDNLWTIGRRLGISPAKIAQWNGLRGSTIYPGQTLIIYTDGRGPAKTLAAQATPKTKPKGYRFVYVVQKGNSLYDIGRFFGVPYRSIMRWNRLRSARIYPGQKLVLYLPKTPRLIEYKIKPGDTLSRISQRYRVRLDHLMGYNGLLPGDPIRANETLKIYRFD